MSSFYTKIELFNLGLKKVGQNVLISKFCRIYNPENIMIGDNVRIDDFCVISGGKFINIGDYVHIASHCGIWGNCGVIMCNFSNISSGVKVYSESDDFKGFCLTGPVIPKKYRINTQNKEIILNKHSLVGANSVVLPGINIGVGTVIGAQSLVNEDCEDWKIYGGVPIRVIGVRDKNILNLEKHLLNTKE